MASAQWWSAHLCLLPMKRRRTAFLRGFWAVPALRSTICCLCWLKLNVQIKQRRCESLPPRVKDATFPLALSLTFWHKLSKESMLIWLILKIKVRLLTMTWEMTSRKTYFYSVFIIYLPLRVRTRRPLGLSLTLLLLLTEKRSVIYLTSFISSSFLGILKKPFPFCLWSCSNELNMTTKTKRFNRKWRTPAV